jgi:membrane protease YdiL (CAAX protease family)
MTRPHEVVRKARIGLLIYFVALCAGSIPIEWMIIRFGLSIGSILALMWVPALASAIARTILREGVSDISFRLSLAHARWALLAALLFPVAVGGVAYGIGWTAGLGSFAPPAMDEFGVHVGSPSWRFAILLASSLVLNVSIGMIFTAGEEIGWRGYMLTRLIAAGVPKPILMSGLVWGLWHIPLILSGRYVTSSGPLLSAALFMVTIVAGGYLIAWLRLATGSVWPAVLFHASWNTVIQEIFDRSTSGRSIWLGESGLLVVIVCVILVICAAPLFRSTVTHASERILAGADSS